MRLIKIISRHHNDFSWLGKCTHCGHEQWYGDGYADNFYCTKVVPYRYCPECGKNCYGETAEPAFTSPQRQPMGET